MDPFLLTYVFQVSSPMYFCETCQQALCVDCKSGTHQARMFASHRIVSVEERAVLHSNDQCELHQQPFILFSTDEKRLRCIKCFRDAQPDARLVVVVGIEAVGEK